MADIDTSTYPKLKQTSPLETLGGVANLQNTLNQNRLFQQEFQSKLGLSKIYKEAIDPATGQLDVNKLRGLMSDPNVTMGLPQAYQNSQEAQQRNIGIDTSQLENQQKHWQAVGSFIAPIISLGNKATSTDVIHQLAAAGAAGLASPDEQAKVYSTLPRTPDGRIDESKVPAWSQQMMLNLQDRQTQLNATMPAPTMQQLPGGGQAPFVLPQVGQVQQVGPTIQAAPPPTTTVVGPDGTPHYVGAPQGNNPYEPGAQGGQAPGGSITGQAAGMSPAASAASTASGGFSAQQGNTLQGRADRVADNKAVLGNLEGELGDFTSGPATEGVAKFAKMVNANVPGANFNPKGLASREQFNKLAGMLAQSQFQALGGTGTDAKLDATTLTSPNSELSKLGNKGIIALLKGNEDAIAAKNQAWQAWQQQNGPASYGQFSTQFNKTYDPRVFQSQYLDDADKKKLIAGMSQQEKNQLHTAFVTAKQNGWIQ